MARFKAFHSFFEFDFTLAPTMFAQLSTQFSDNANITLVGRVYQDVAAYDYPNGIPHTFYFGGTDLTRATNTSVSGGTVTGIFNYYNRIGQYQDPIYAIQGISLPGATLGAAMSSQDTTDDLQFLATVLSGNDTFLLSAEDDIVSGYAGNDRMIGNAGNDLLNGGAGTDTLNGGDGDDQLEGGAGDDLLLGKAGTDTASYQYADAGVTVDLRITVQQDTIGAGKDTLSGFERLYGSAFADTLTGTGGDNELIGLDGDDVISGLGGADRIDGYGGHDTLTGGSGADRFVVFAFTGPSDADTITDFSRKQGDKVLLSKLTFGLTGQVGDALSANEFYIKGGATAAHDADDRIIYDPRSGAVYYDADGLGGDAAVQILTMGTGTTHPYLAASDFELSF
jgi:Ca2+-binding RTX toxin-like protein